MFHEEIASKFVTENIAVGVDKDIFIGRHARLPKSDGPFFTLIESGGFTPIQRHDRAWNPYQQPSMQIVARASSSSIARNKAREAYDALVGIRNETIGDGQYLWIHVLQEPFELPVDEQGRARFAFNINVLRVTIQ